MSRPDSQASAAVDDALLRGWPLPLPGPDSDKEARGRLLVIAGSRQMPGAAVLAAIAALRAGAGKLAVATAASVASGVALALPEGRVMALPETASGGFALEGVAILQSTLERADAVLVGPGVLDEDATVEFVRAILPLCGSAAVILDAGAMSAARGPTRFERPVLLTPHAGEMAHLLDAGKDAVAEAPADRALAASRRWNAVVALKGAVTHIAAPDGRLWRHDRGHTGLGTSGSGDVLAGLITGLAARGASLEQAAIWGVALHARAGEVLGREHGTVGYLAREIAVRVPALMHGLMPPPV